ncbi:MAG: geranylgeranylglyceryl/heptaprenylglyceryl phosphate synthase [Flavobacteriales bacterium]|nr:geranylgeranylglyceryl/heptaprenylglyceryl phosphate synthase [Flavobacteriales bacterium]|tara:strand:- start:838 stop:1575 length:738 start_codon:yes stop_codon:yes gene_type:complete
MRIYNKIISDKKANKKSFALLIDPDKQDLTQLLIIINKAEKSKVDYFFVGGSLLTYDSLDTCLKTIKNNSTIPVVLFPGNAMQVNDKADGILFLSLISGRNAEMLIGKQVITAPILKQSSLEVLSTGYILVDSGKPTTASYMSNTTPIPADKDTVSACTAMAGEMLGLKLIFMDGGSGAKNPISSKMIATVSKSIDAPLIIGGGINSGEKALVNCKAGADIIVVGNAIEKNEDLISEISSAVHQF